MVLKTFCTSDCSHGPIPYPLQLPLGEPKAFWFQTTTLNEFKASVLLSHNSLPSPPSYDNNSHSCVYLKLPVWVSCFPFVLMSCHEIPMMMMVKQVSLAMASKLGILLTWFIIVRFCQWCSLGGSSCLDFRLRRRRERGCW